MINSSNDYELMYEVIRSVALEYNWSDKFIREIKNYEINDEVLKAYTGKYLFDKDCEIIINKDAGKLSLKIQSQPPVYLFAESDDTFYSDQLNIKVIFYKSANEIENLEIQQEGANNINAQRIKNN